MGKLAVFLLILCLSAVFSGCSLLPVSSEGPSPPITKADRQAVDYRSVHIIQSASEKNVLIDGTYYEITPTSTFKNASGATLQPEELNLGDLVYLTASKKTTSQIPGKGTLLSLTRHEDDRSNSISKAVGHVLENQEAGDIIAPEIRSVSSHLVTLQFRDLANERKYECIVNIKSLEFHVKEIPNS